MKLSVEEQNRPDANWSGRGLVGGIKMIFQESGFFSGKILLGGPGM